MIDTTVLFLDLDVKNKKTFARLFIPIHDPLQIKKIKKTKPQKIKLEEN